MTHWDKVELQRRRFSAALRDLHASGEEYLDPAPTLEEINIANCKVLRDRYAILEQLPVGGVVAEIGVDTGAFSKEILERCRPRKLYLLELDPTRIDRSNIAVGLDQGIVEIIKGDSQHTLSKFEDGFFDWIYVDGNHKYSGVAGDARIAAQKVGPEGRLVFNDYTVWSPRTMMHCGVARAVNELCLADGWELEYLCFQRLFYNDVVIRRI